jgi:hypothetical protein
MSDPQAANEETKKTAMQSAKAWGGMHFFSLFHCNLSILADWL